MQRLLLAVALMTLATCVNAQVYKWTDAGGTVHFSQSPPPEGVRFSTIKTNVNAGAPGAAEPAAATPAAAAMPSPAAETAAAPVAEKQQNRQSLCASLAANITVLQGNQAVAMGKSVLDAAQRQQQLASAQAQQTQYCKNP